MKEDKAKKIGDDTKMVEGEEELTDEDKAMYKILWGRDWDEDYPANPNEK